MADWIGVDVGKSSPRTKACKHCRTEFVTEWPKQVFCTKKCRQDFFNAKHSMLQLSARIPRPCDICGAEYTPTRSDSLTCSNSCRGRLNYERSRNWRTDWMRKRRAARRGVLTENFTLADIAERDGWCCRICGKLVDPELKWPHIQCATVDHIVPIKMDGEHSKANCQLAHADCNRRKGSTLRDPVQLALIG